MFGHTELFTPEMQKEYLAWCQTDDGGGEDYDWFDIDFDNAVMEALMLMAEKKGI